VASFNRKLKKHQEKINKQNEKKITAVMNRDKDLLTSYISEINLTKSYGTEKTLVVEDEVFLNNLDNFVKNFEEMGKQGKAEFDEGKAQLAFAGITDILETKQLRVTTLRYLMLIIIFQLWDIEKFYDSDEFESVCENSNLKLLQNGFWSDNLYVIQYINKYFYFEFNDSGALNINIR